MAALNWWQYNSWNLSPTNEVGNGRISRGCKRKECSLLRRWSSVLHDLSGPNICFPLIGCDISAELAICWPRQSTIGDKGLVYSQKMKLQLTNHTDHTCHYSYFCLQMLLTKVQVWHWWWVLYYPCFKSSSIFDSNLIHPIWGDWRIWPLTIHLSNLAGLQLPQPM